MESAVYQKSPPGPEGTRPTSPSAVGRRKEKVDQSLLTPAAPSGVELDADNRLLSHFPLRRLEAEAVRDAMLSVSGQLESQVGGPGFRPFKVTVSGSHFYELIDPVGTE